MDPAVVQAEVAGGSGISMQAEEGGDPNRPSVKGTIKWEGLSGAITIYAAYGILEFEREFRIVDARVLHEDWWYLA